MLFGGTDDMSATFPDTWLFGRFTRAITQPFGSACAGTSGPPVLTSNDPYLGNPAFRFVLASARASSMCLFAYSAGTQAQAIGPCTLYLSDPIVSLQAASDAAGFAESATFALPLDNALRGATFYVQAFVVDSQGPVLGLAASAGLRLVLGD